MDTLQVFPKLLIGATKISFYVIGAGGTGSYLIRDLARIVSINNKKYKRNDTITIIDADAVEEKNLARQNFVSKDIGNNKAQVLAKRYSSSFGLDIAYVAEYITADNIYHIVESENSLIVVIGCVDNNKTRHMIHEWYRTSYNNSIVYIDSGNEEFGGQVVFSCNRALQIMSSISPRQVMVKDIVEQFQIDKNDRHPGEMSCAEHAESAPQNIATNILAANIIFNYCNLIISSSIRAYPTGPMDAEIDDYQIQTGLSRTRAIEEMIRATSPITNHVTFFNSKTGSISTLPFEATSIIRP